MAVELIMFWCMTKYLKLIVVQSANVWVSTPLTLGLNGGERKAWGKCSSHTLCTEEGACVLVLYMLLWKAAAWACLVDRGEGSIILKSRCCKDRKGMWLLFQPIGWRSSWQKVDGASVDDLASSFNLNVSVLDLGEIPIVCCDPFLLGSVAFCQ